MSVVSSYDDEDNDFGISTLNNELILGRTDRKLGLRSIVNLLFRGKGFCPVDFSLCTSKNVTSRPSEIVTDWKRPKYSDKDLTSITDASIEETASTQSSSLQTSTSESFEVSNLSVVRWECVQSGDYRYLNSKDNESGHDQNEKSHPKDSRRGLFSFICLVSISASVFLAAKHMNDLPSFDIVTCIRANASNNVISSFLSLKKQLLLSVGNTDHSQTDMGSSLRNIFALLGFVKISCNHCDLSREEQDETRGSIHTIFPLKWIELFVHMGWGIIASCMVLKCYEFLL